MSQPRNRIVRKFFRVYGFTSDGSFAKSDGKSINCQHEHTDKESAAKCRDDMQVNDPSNCAKYKIMEVRIHKLRTEE